MNKKFQIINLSIFLLLLIANIFVFLNRDKGYVYTEKLSFDQLYQIKEQTRITDIDIAGTSVSIKMSSNGTEEKQINLVPGKKIYQLPLNKDTLKLGLNFTPESTFSANGRSRADVVELYYSNKPVGDHSLHALDDWQYFTESTESEKNSALKLLKEEAAIAPTDPDQIKMQKIAAHLIKTFALKRGIPSDSMDLFSPTERYHFAKAGYSKVWCGDLASMYSFFLQVYQIPSRLVSLEGKHNKVYKAGHVFNEVYLADQQQWVFSDLTSGLILVQDKKGRYMNTLDLYSAFKTEAALQFTLAQDSAASVKDSKQIQIFYNYYFQSNNKFTFYLRKQFLKNTYGFTSKLKRYLLPRPTFAVYGGYSEADNSKFYFKQFLVVSFLLFLLYWIIVTLILKLKKRTAI